MPNVRKPDSHRIADLEHQKESLVSKLAKKETDIANSDLDFKSRIFKLEREVTAIKKTLRRNKIS